MRCPVCHQPLVHKDRRFECPNKHCFDQARQGYVNLSRRRKAGGDNADMVRARTAFLESGAYDFLRQQLCSIVASQSPGLLIDLGCGEGYYTREMARHAALTFGIDLSTASLRHAAACDRMTQYVAASIYDLPFDDGCADLLTSIFTPIPAREAARVLKPSGLLCTVTPGLYHHYELKEMLYETVRLNDPLKTPEGFEQVEQIVLKEKKQVDDLMSLLEMTPYRYKCRPEAVEALRARSEGTPITFEFVITLWRKA